MINWLKRVMCLHTYVSQAYMRVELPQNVDVLVAETKCTRCGKNSFNVIHVKT